jgi:hypothetical protein
MNDHKRKFRKAQTESSGAVLGYDISCHPALEGWRGTEESEFTAKPPGLTALKNFLYILCVPLQVFCQFYVRWSATQSDITVCDVSVQHCTDCPSDRHYVIPTPTNSLATALPCFASLIFSFYFLRLCHFFQPIFPR